MNLIKYLLLLFIVVINVQSLENVSLQLLWKNQFEFAGYYMAKEKGFYKEVGLDVSFIEYKNGINIVDEVVSQNVDFGIGYPDIIISKSNGSDIILLDAIFQSSPHVLVTLESSNIKKIEDFKNKRVMIDISAYESVATVAMFKSHNISEKDFVEVENSYSTDDILEGRVDAMTIYISNELYNIKKSKKPFKIWNPADYGFDLYNDILFTSSKLIKNNPKKVEDFKKASLKGWEYAFSHIQESVDVILKKYNTQHKTKEALVYEAKVLKKLAYKGVVNIGKIENAKIQRLIDIYNVLGLIKRPIDVSSFIYHKELNISKDEYLYLSHKKVLKVCVDPNWMPFEGIVNGKYVGMNADYFKLFEKFIGTDIAIVKTKSWQESLKKAQQRECDILSLAINTKDRQKYLNFTTTYLELPVVVATRLDARFITTFHALKGKKIGIPKGYANKKILKEKYPFLDIVDVKNIEDGLQKVRDKKLYGFVGGLAPVGYYIQREFLSELKISGKFEEKWNLGVGVRNDEPQLLSIMQKAVDSIDVKTRQKILNDWLSITFKNTTDYKLIFQMLTGFILIIAIIGIFYTKLYRLNIKLEKQKEKLEFYASRDPLTKLYNRRYFEQISKELINLAKIDKSDISVIMLDIDDFKIINDTYGHKVGDDVLVSLACEIQKVCRKSDLSCRCGGEEFVVVYPQTSIENALIVTQKLRKNITKLIVETFSDKVSWSVSIGLSRVDLDNENTLDGAIARADKALYEAKNGGKNMVCVKDII